MIIQTTTEKLFFCDPHLIQETKKYSNRCKNIIFIFRTVNKFGKHQSEVIIKDRSPRKAPNLKHVLFKVMHTYTCISKRKCHLLRTLATWDVVHLPTQKKEVIEIRLTSGRKICANLQWAISRLGENKNIFC